MRKKSVPAVEPIIAPEIMERAKRSLTGDLPQRPAKCTVCGSDCSFSSSEQLCWVCRRLKISAWRDADLQQPANPQE